MTAPHDDADSDRSIPVARSGWMPPRFFVLYGLAGAALHFVPGAPVLLRLPWLGVTLWGARTFAVAGTAIKPYERTHQLVEAGPFRFTRNPMYLGMLSMLAGIAFALGSPGPWLATLAHGLTLQLRFIRHEERALAASLGEVYAQYRGGARRWL